VLFARLVKRYTGLPVIGLDYPGHVSVGVCFSTPVPGDSVQFRKRNYLICDPTIINAKVGNASDSMNAVKPDVIEVNADATNN
jgi:arginine/lysine/ornithine decarboxylase